MVKRLIKEYSKPEQKIFDPFLGSGVAAVESAILRRRFYGFDINPLAVLISRVRVTPIERKLLIKNLQKILKKYPKIKSYKPDFMNIDYWFTDITIKSISKIVKCINQIENIEIRNFFKVSLSEAIRKVSRTKTNEFKLVRSDKLNSKSTLTVFEKKSRKNIKSLCDFYSNNSINYKPKVEQLNLIKDELPLENEKVSLLITSPPYGDSQTTVAYGQFSRLSLQWLGLKWRENRNSLGYKKIEINKKIPSPALYKILKNVESEDKSRAKQVFSFYFDLFKAFNKLIPKVKIGGNLIFVVGNRTVKGFKLPTDLICSQMLESLNCYHEKTLIRQIGNKRMPYKNSPTNIVGEKASTMRQEFIIICKRGN